MRFAILIDGGFMLKRLQSLLQRDPRADDVTREARLITEGVPAGDGLLRVLYYDAPPYGKSVPNIARGGVDHLNKTAQFQQRRSLLQELEQAPDFALRLGELVFDGYKIDRRTATDISKERRPVEARDFEMLLEQKGVDMRIGLDIARLSLRDRVGALVLVTADSDFIPAMKFARREGVRVYLDPMGASVRSDLRAHADVVLERDEHGARTVPRW